MEKLLIVDDSEEIRTQLKWGFNKDYSLSLARDAKEALVAFRKLEPAVVTLDLGLPPDEDGTEEGFRCLKEMLQGNISAKIIVITGNDERENALKAIQLGAYYFYQKPINLDELKVIIKRAFHLSAIEQENRSLHLTLERQTAQSSGMIGHCPEMNEIFTTMRKVATADAAVLIQGESGTGKELVARAIHSMSTRKDGPFVAINCGAIPETLLEAELFGHEKGAFTGAHAQVQGKVEFANDGTLFLDEIGELPLQLQVKLLRFLQDRMIQRVGGRENIFVNTRIIAATNKDLSNEIKANKFREDLYYRIGVVMIKVPPLRERKGDGILLATYFLKRFADLYKKRVRGFSSTTIERIDGYDWPGNVRELENRVQRAVIMSEGALVEPQDMGFPAEAAGRGCEEHEVRTLKDAKDRIERELVIHSLDRNKGNIARSAEELGISRPTLYDLMKKHGMYNEPIRQENAETGSPNGA